MPCHVSSPLHVERAVALSQAPRIGVDPLFSGHAGDAYDAPPTTLAEIRDRAGRQHIRAVIADVDNRIDEAAKRLGISRSTLFDKRRPPRRPRGRPDAPAPTPPDPVWPRPCSGGAAAMSK